MNINAAEIARGERFEFGQNWSQFLSALDEQRIQQAEKSLREMLEVDSLAGKTFLDIGSGSGLFSLAARRLGARVRSFDFDPKSVACTRQLKKRFFSDDDSWKIEEASALDQQFMKSLGQFDVVYSWGVLHHTGNLWAAMENAQERVAPGGKLFIALYNDTGSQSARWLWIKKKYNSLPGVFRMPFAVLVSIPDELKLMAKSALTLNPRRYIDSWTNYRDNRGMTKWRDIVDWVGGYPYEVSTPDEVFDFCRERGFTLTKLKCGYVGKGCNEFVFEKRHEED